MNAIIQEIPFHAEEPEPLFSSFADGQAYPVNALETLGKMVWAIRGKTLAPEGIAAQSVLSIASLAVQGFANVETLGGYTPLSLYCLTIAQSGERKTSCDKLAMQALRKFEKEQAEYYQKESKQCKAAHDSWSAKREKILSDLRKQDNIALEADLHAHEAQEPKAPILTDRIVSEPTYEGLTRLFAEGQPSLGLFSDEGGQFLGGFAMSKEHRQKTLAALNQLWDGNAIRRTRRCEAATTLYDRRLAIHLMVQPVAANELIANPLSADIGFLPRFLICKPTSNIGTRMHKNITHNDGAIDAFSKRLSAILNRKMPMDEFSYALLPRKLPLAQGAKDLLIAFSDEIELAQAPSKKFETITAFASKIAEQAARIAGVLTLWRDLDAEQVTAETMRNAITLARYYLNEAQRLMGDAIVPDDLRDADALRVWLLEKWPHDEILPGEIATSYPKRALRVTAKAKAAIAVLVRHGWLVAMEQGSIVRGKARKEAYRIVRTGNHHKDAQEKGGDHGQ